MRIERTPLDRLIQSAIDSVARSESGYFKKSEIVDALARGERVAALLANLRTHHGAWKIDRLILRYIEGRVGRELQRRDSNRVRIYECYAAGEHERRWMPLRAMTAQNLRLVMKETQVRARQLERKGEVYHRFIIELEKLSASATVNDIYDRAIDNRNR